MSAIRVPIRGRHPSQPTLRQSIAWWAWCRWRGHLSTPCQRCGGELRILCRIPEE